MTDTDRSSHIRSRGWLAVVATLLTLSCADGGGVTGPPPTGALEVAISGLPDGVVGRMIVSGPNSTDTLSTSATLYSLVPGPYQISAEDIDTDEASHLASPSIQSVLVSAGVRVTRKVDYRPGAPRTGGWNVAVEGLPNGASGAITVSGPRGYRHFMTSTTNTYGVSVGNYEFTAEDVTAGGKRYRPDPDRQTLVVTQGNIREATVRYRSADAGTGALSFVTSGLPAGAAAAVNVLGPEGFSQLLTNTTTIYGAPTGSYTFTALRVVVGGASYDPAPPSQAATVTTATTSTVSVAYALAVATTGTLSLNISGLPSGAAAAVTIAGPDGFSQAITNTTTITGVPVGTYSILARPVSVNGVTFLPRDPTQTLGVAAGSTTTETVAYAAAPPTLGSLDVAVSGLGAGATAAITISGPNGFTRSLTSATRLDSLAPGSYTVAASEVLANGVANFPTPASQVTTVIAGATAAVSVGYAIVAPTTGALHVDVIGLGGGAGATITISGPNGYSRSIAATEAIDGLAPGTYTVSATDILVNGVSFVPTPASQIAIVTAGAVAVTPVSYAAVVPTTGALTVNVSGLSLPAAAAIIVTGPSGYSRTLTSTTTIDGLAPGDYAIAASNVPVSGVSYLPTPPSQVATVTAGTATTKSVSYAAAAPTTGQLTVTLSGLPGGTAAAISVTGPNSYSHTVTANETIASLLAGTYTVTASNVTSGGVSYAPAASSQSVAVVAGATATRSVVYAAVAPTTGQLTVTVSGLPGGAAAAITVTGPNSYSRTVTASETIAALVAGSYTVTASNVTSGGTSYAPAVSSQSVAVVAGAAATRSVAYAAAPAVAATVTVDTMVRHQQIIGWEATSEAGEDEVGFAGYQSELMDLAANDLGINRLRLELLSGAENTVDYYAQFRAGTITEAQWSAQRYAWVNDNSSTTSINAAGFKFSKLDTSIEATVLPIRTRLAARGEQLYLNLNYVSFRGSTAQQDPAEYAELLLATFQHMQSRYGFVPDAVEVILEPDNNTIRSGTSIGQLIVSTGARLAAAGFHPDFIAPSVTNMANAVPYLDQVVAVPGALSYLTEVAYHRYAGVSDANLAAIKSRASQYGLRTSMLEHIGSGVEDLYKDLTLANVSAWQQYTLAYPAADNGGHYYGISGGRPVIGSRTVLLRQYFRYVRSGAQRVAATSINSAVRPVAFTNPGAGMAVVLHVDAPGTFTVRGLRAGTYQVGMASTTGTVISFANVVAVAGGSVSISPAQTGVLTLNRLP